VIEAGGASLGTGVSGIGPGRTDRNSLVAAAGLALVHLALAALSFDPTLHPGGDNAAYLDLARSLLERGRYLSLWEPGSPPHLQYPPGFPALLALAMALGVEPWAGLKVLVVLVSTTAVGLSYLWARTRLRAGPAFCVGLLVAVAPGIVGQSRWILSDVPFWAATMGALLAAGRGRAAVGAALAFVALTLRTAGLPLVLAFGVWFALRRRWRGVVLTTVALAVVSGLWLVRGPAVGPPYVSSFRLADPYDPAAGLAGPLDLALRAGENSRRYTLDLLMEVLIGHAGTAADIVAVLLLGGAAVGFVCFINSSCKQCTDGVTAGGAAGIEVPELWLPLYTVVLLLWPQAWASERFLLPVLPALLVLATLPLTRLSTPARRVVGVLVVAGLVVAGLPATVEGARSARHCRDLAAAQPQRAERVCLRPNVRAFLALAEWSREGLPAEAVVLSRKPMLYHWFGHRTGYTYPFRKEPGALLAAMDSAGADFVAVDRLGLSAQTYLVPELRRFADRFCVVRAVRDETSRATLLARVPARPAGAPPGPDPDLPGIAACTGHYVSDSSDGSRPPLR